MLKDKLWSRNACYACVSCFREVAGCDHNEITPKTGTSNRNTWNTKTFRNDCKEAPQSWIRAIVCPVQRVACSHSHGVKLACNVMTPLYNSVILCHGTFTEKDKSQKYPEVSGPFCWYQTLHRKWHHVWVEKLRTTWRTLLDSNGINWFNGISCFY